MPVMQISDRKERQEGVIMILPLTASSTARLEDHLTLPPIITISSRSRLFFQRKKILNLNLMSFLLVVMT